MQKTVTTTTFYCDMCGKELTTETRANSIYSANVGMAIDYPDRIEIVATLAGGLGGQPPRRDFCKDCIRRHVEAYLKNI